MFATQMKFRWNRALLLALVLTALFGAGIRNCGASNRAPVEKILGTLSPSTVVHSLEAPFFFRTHGLVSESLSDFIPLGLWEAKLPLAALYEGIESAPLPAAAQDKSDDAKTTQSDAKAQEDDGEKPKRAAPRGRLPMYYSRVVTEKQRLDIYSMQHQYNQQIAELQKQIDQLVTTRNEKVAGILSTDQLAEVTRMVEDAKKRRAAAKKGTPTSSGNN